MKMQFTDWARNDRSFLLLGGFSPSETGGEPVMINLQFRLATNGVIVNTLINGKPLITTSAGLFNR